MFLFCSSNSSFADPSGKVSATINTIVEFSNLKGNSSGKMSDKTYNKGTRLLNNALSQGSSISNAALSNKFGNKNLQSNCKNIRSFKDFSNLFN